MPHITRRTPELDARILEMHKRGTSLRGIERELATAGTPVSRPTITAVIAQAKAAEPEPRGVASEKVGGGQGPDKGTDDAASDASGNDGDTEGAEEDDDEEVLAGLPPLPEYASVAARLCYAELVETRRAARKVYRRVLTGRYPMNQWVSAKAHVLRLLKSLGEMIPAPPADPSKDPMSLACRELTHGLVLQSMRVAQTQLGHLCPSCRVEPRPRG